MKNLTQFNPRKILTATLACGLFFGVSGAIFAQNTARVNESAAKAPLSSVLQAFKVTQGEGGEKLTAAEQIAPGEVIEYQLRYSNRSSKAIRDLQATLPIPAQATLLKSSVVPASARASVNGRVFAAMPLRRRVKAPNGTTQIVDVPLAQYRAVRWQVPALGAGKSVVFKMRARINSTQ